MSETAGSAGNFRRFAVQAVAFGLFALVTGVLSVWPRFQLLEPGHVIEASTPGGISVESISTLKQYAFKDALIEAIGKAALKAEKLGDAV